VVNYFSPFNPVGRGGRSISDIIIIPSSSGHLQKESNPKSVLMGLGGSKWGSKSFVSVSQHQSLSKGSCQYSPQSDEDGR